LKACVDIEEFLDDWSVVESHEDLSDVYILIDASLTEDEESPEFAQKMNICAYCLDDDILEEIAS